MALEYGTTWLVNRRTDRHIGPFTTLLDAMFAVTIAADAENWRAFTDDEFQAYLRSDTLPGGA